MLLGIAHRRTIYIALCFVKYKFVRTVPVVFFFVFFAFSIYIYIFSLQSIYCVFCVRCFFFLSFFFLTWFFVVVRFRIFWYFSFFRLLLILINGFHFHELLHTGHGRNEIERNGTQLNCVRPSGQSSSPFEWVCREKIVNCFLLPSFSELWRCSDVWNWVWKRELDKSLSTHTPLITYIFSYIFYLVVSSLAFGSFVRCLTCGAIIVN